MRAIPPALQAKLDSGATTLAQAWILTRRDDVVLGFTDHDRDLTVAGVLCRAATGLDGAAMAEKAGFAVAGGEIAGALTSEAITEADVTAGRYDGASVAIHLVDWSEPSLSVLLRVAAIGEIRREDGAFRAELRSAAHKLDEERGRLFTPRCSADLGDARCGVNLALAARRAVGTVTGLAASGEVAFSGLGGIAAGSLVGGRLEWLTGPDAGRATEIATHVLDGAIARLTLWDAPASTATGATARASVGCDKLFSTCRDRFANALNFRGFPHMPGNDRVLAVASPGEPGHDGAAYDH